MKRDEAEQFFFDAIDDIPFQFDLFVDVGVGPGREAWKAREMFGHEWDCRIIGYEPHPKRYNEIAEYFPGALNRHAVGDRHGVEVTLYSGPANELAKPAPSVMADPGAEYDDQRRVYMTTLDDELLLQNYIETGTNGPGHGILWADIEGAELMMLQGAKKCLDAGVFSVLNLECRFHPRTQGACTFGDLVNFLMPFDFFPAMLYNYSLENDMTVSHFDCIFLHERIVPCMPT